MASAVVGALRVVLSLDSAEFDTAMKRVSSSAKDWGNDLTNIGRQATAVGSALTRTLTLPLVGLGLAAVKSASDFESSFAGVRKTVEATEPEFAALAQGLRDMAKEIPVSVNELNKVAESAGQLGIKKEDIIAFTRTMADLGVTTNLTADEAATATAQIQNIFGAAGKDVDRFGATLVALGNAGASTEKDIVEMGKRIAGAGHQVGLTQAQVLAFASALSSVGINAEAGGSAISRVFLKINDAVAKGGSGMTEFARVSGMTASQFKQAWEKDAATATTAFITGLGRLKAEGENVNATIEGLVGKNIILKDTLLRASGAGTLLTEQLALGNKAWQENTALTTEAGKRYETFSSQLTILWNKLQDVAITFGNALLPMLKAANNAIKDLVPILDRMAKGFAGLPLPVQAIAVGFAALVAAAGPAIWIFGQLTLAAGTVIKAFTSKGIAMRAITTVMESTGMSAAGLGKHVGLLSGVFGTLTGAIGAVARVLTGSVGIALTAVDVSIRALTGNSHSLFSIVTDMATVLGDALTRGLKSVWEWTKSAWEVTEKWAGAVGEFVSGAASEFGQLLYDWVPAIRAVVDGFALWGQKLGLITKEGAAFWAEQAEHVRTTREVEKWVDKTSESLTEQARKAKESALSNDLLAGANRVLADEYKRVEAESKKTAVAIALSEAQIKAAKAAADAFAKSLSALGGRDALAGAEEVVKQLGALGGPLNVLPGKLDEMAGRLREAAQAALMMGKTGLAEQYTKLAATLSPIIQFQQRFNVTIGEYVTDAHTAAAATHALWEQFHRLTGQVQTIAPLLKNGMDLSKLFVGFKESVTEHLPKSDQWAQAWSGMKEGLSQTLASIPQTLSAAFTGGGDIMGALKSIVSQIGATVGGAIGSAFGGPMGQKIGAALGSMSSMLVEPLKKIFGIGINDAVKKANVEIGKLKQNLIDTHGPLEKLEAMAQAVGLSFEAAWGHQGQAGLKEFSKLVDEFEKRWDELNENLKDTQGELDGLIGKARDLGYEFDQSGEFIGVSFDTVKQKADEFGVSVEGLGPKFRQQGIDAEAGKIINAFTLLEKAGGDVGGILVGMKDEIGKIVGDSIKFGTVIPKNMEPWVKELIRTNQLVDENGVSITDLSLIKFGDPVATQFETIALALKEVVDKLAAILSQISAIPEHKTFRLEKEYHDPGPPPGFFDGGGGGNDDRRDDPPPFATGTLGRYGQWFGNFPKTGMSAVLHGVEAVITPQQAPAFAMEVLGGMMPASSGGGDMSALLSEIQGLRRELNTTIPAIAESAARHGSQTSGRRR